MVVIFHYEWDLSHGFEDKENQGSPEKFPEICFFLVSKNCQNPDNSSGSPLDIFLPYSFGLYSNSFFLARKPQYL